MYDIDEEDASETSLESGDIFILDEKVDLSQITIHLEPKSLDVLINRMRHNYIDLYTNFQRSGNLWNDVKASRLIESIMAGFPLPAFYFDASDDKNWKIIDGLQRLSVLRRFVLFTEKDYISKYVNKEEISVNKTLKLKGLEYFTEFNNFSFVELPNYIQNKIKETTIPIYFVKASTPDVVKYSIFYRLNTGGIALKPQEIRHALNTGKKSDIFLERVVEMDVFRRIVPIKSQRMEKQEIVLRAVSFYLLDDIERFTGSLIKFLNSSMTLINDMSLNDLDDLYNKLEQTFVTIENVYGENVFSRNYLNNNASQKFSRPIFEALVVTLMKQKESFFPAKDSLRKLYNNPAFIGTIEKSTTGSRKVEERFRLFHLLFNPKSL